MKKKGIKKFGWARAFVVFWLALLGVGYLSIYPLVGILFLLSMLYMIFMDTINERLFEKKTEDEEPVKYDPSALGEPIKCPYCGKSIPSGIQFCYYCGNNIEEFKRIEALRVSTLKQIDDALIGIEDGAPKEDIKKIKNLTNKIIKKYEEKSDHSHDEDKFMAYYLPKTISAIEHYHVLCTLEDLDGDELKIKAQLEDSLDMLADAFSNIFNRISTEGLYDISADVSVLETILKQDGLAESDFPV